MLRTIQIYIYTSSLLKLGGRNKKNISYVKQTKYRIRTHDPHGVSYHTADDQTCTDRAERELQLAETRSGERTNSEGVLRTSRHERGLVVILSGYFRRAHGSISGSRLSADYQVRVVDEDSDEYVAEETLQDTQSEADGEITDVPQGGDGSVENEPQSIRISATSCRQSYRALTPTLKVSESRKLEAAKRERARQSGES
ncbi:hypothetical protein V1519DRAFT_433958 [Lipomyces tetrasporus]